MSTQSLLKWAGRFAAAAVLLAGTPALAAAPALNTTAKSIPKGPSRDRYSKGQTAYDNGQYVEAGKAWADVLDQLPEEPRNQAKRAGLILDIMAAYTAAYRLTGNEAELEAGLAHYFRYFGVYKAAYGNPRIPRKVVDARYALRDLLRDAKAEPAEVSPQAPTGSQDPRSTDSATNRDPVPADSGNGSGRGVNVSVSGGGSQSDRAGTPLIVAGAAVLAVGVGASSMIAIGAIEGKRAREEQHTDGLTEEQRDRVDQRGRTMNGLFIAGLVTTPILLGGGAALLAIGVKRSRNRRIQAVVPRVNRRFVGLSVRGRF